MTRDPISWLLWSLVVSFTVGGGGGGVVDFTLTGQQLKTSAPRWSTIFDKPATTRAGREN